MYRDKGCIDGPISVCRNTCGRQIEPTASFVYLAQLKGRRFVAGIVGFIHGGRRSRGFYPAVVLADRHLVT